MKKNWKVKKRKFPGILTQLLVNRGITTKTQRLRFLEPRYERDLADPFLMRDMKKAVARICSALKNREKIGIFGDYDVDGVCGSVILSDFFERFGVSPFFETYLPDRQRDGYGLNMHGLTHFKKQGVTLLITVDCGITDHKEIAWAGKHGMEVIVTDHHEVSQGLPPAFAVLNPKRKNERFPFAGLAGTGVAFKLLQALRKKVNHEKISEAWEKWILDLVAFATVADQMPLVSENRVLVKYGLFIFAKTKRIGLQELIKSAGIDEAEITTEHLLYQLAPRVNAASRIDHALKAFKLLKTNDRNEARVLASEIDKANKERQRLVQEAMKEVQALIEERRGEIQKEKFIFEGSKHWQPGVCGLVSNKIMERYGYPTFIYSIGKEMAKGSVRSYPPFSVVQAMKSAGKLLIDWGGHHQAGGFSIAPKNLDAFRQILKKYVAESAGEEFTPSLEIDAELEAKDITLELWQEVSKLEPFGKGNPEPLFLLKNAAIWALRKVGQDESHFKLTLQKDDRFFEAIYFRGVQDNGDLQKGDSVDVVFTLKRSTWGMTKVELSVVDLRRVT
ncbi:MAG: single-stranded-DNA-specific exonuclease RecJ [Candidatus Portnoybacteria bacterium]|nr:single-stranded-DNA-specific exonuclease RecJ [Candidatus Portnoybacteria bacterium]